MRDRLIELLDGADLFLRNRANAKPAPLNEYDIENLKDIAKVCDEAARTLEKAIIPPCEVGDWIWYVYRNEINKAKVEEIQYDVSKHGNYSYNFSIYAYDFKNKREVTYHPINETTKNKSNINGVEGMDWGEDVFIFLTKEEAEKALKEREG